MTYERDNIRSMKGYVWGEQPTDVKTCKLNTNENPYPPSPGVQRALAAFDAGALRTYPQPTADPLREAIAEHHGLAPENVIVTNGGDEGLRLAITTFVEPGTPVGIAAPSYSLYPVLAEIHEAPVQAAELDADWLPPADFAQRMNEAGVRLTCLPNPHAPSGSLLDAGYIRQLAGDIDGVLLIDEAYADFIDPKLGYDAVSLMNGAENLLILRSFSKGYSLAGLRLGYLLGHTGLIEPILTKTRDSYNVNGIAQAVGLAAFKDQAHAQRTWVSVRNARERLAAQLQALGFTMPPSQTNFLLAEPPARSPTTAKELYLALKARGVLVRYFDAPRLRDKLRITVGTEDQNARLVAEIANSL